MLVMTNSPLRHFPGWLVVALSTTLLSLPTAAESGSILLNGTVFATGRSALASADCGQARDASRCLAIRRAREICQVKKGVAKRHCLQKMMPAPDCGNAPDPRRCQARQQARLACQGKPDKELRKCLRQANSPPISNIN
ncbi:MAG: hypothetical protein PHQ05_07470 [Sterolibacterium sp.]|nr:hypothetical protein [Sterolibacterium sp.]